MERKLTAILAADVVGYARLRGEDETGTLAALKAVRNETIDPRIAEHGGRTDDAEWEAEEILSRQPYFTLADILRRTPDKNSSDLERWIAGLRRAGLPE